MLFEKLVIHNFGIYKGRHEIELKPKNKDKPIILIGALNGAGKTTFLDAILLVFYGKFAKCSNRGVLGYQEYLKQAIQKDIDPQEGAKIEIDFSHEREGVQEKIRIIRSWSSTGKKIKESIEVYSNGELDDFLTERWYEYVEEFIPSQISNLFFFDGERIEGLASTDKTCELIRTGLYALLGLDIIDRLTQDLATIEKKQAFKNKSTKEKINIKILEDEIEFHKTERSNISQELASTRNEIYKIETVISDLKKEYRKKGGDLVDKKSAIEVEQKTTAKEYEYITQELKDLASESAPLFLVEKLLDRAYEQSQKEIDAKKQIDIKNELSMRDKEAIQYLESIESDPNVIDSLSVFFKKDREKRNTSNDIKIYLNANPIDFLKLSPSKRKKTKSTIKEAIEKSKLKKKELNSIASKIAATPTRDALQKITEATLNSEKKQNESKARLIYLEQEHFKFEKLISEKEKYFLGILEEATKSQFEELSNKRIFKHSEKLRNTFSEFQKRIINSKLKKIEELVFESYSTIMKKDDLIAKIHINPETFQLSLIDNRGNILLPERLSAGERQLLVISILWSFSKASGSVLPSVIDTPLGRLDGKHRQLLVENYFPNAGQQVILLSTDEEIDKSHYRSLQEHISHSYLISYEQSQSSSVISKGYFNE